MLSIDQGPSRSSGGTVPERVDRPEADHDQPFRDIHALTPLPPPPGRRRETWETSSHRSSSLSVASSELAPSENFTSMSREFSNLVLAGSAIGVNSSSSHSGNNNNSNGESNGMNMISGGNYNNLGSIGEEDRDDLVPEEETNPLAIVPDSNPLREPTSSRSTVVSSSTGIGGHVGELASVHRVKKEEVESKISAWQNAKIAKINNRFKREDAVINGWESEQVQKASSWMKKVERKLEEKRARALEKMQNDVAKAHRKAEERRASSEAKRGTKVARVLEVANLMRAVGRAPAKKSFF